MRASMIVGGCSLVMMGVAAAPLAAQSTPEALADRLAAGIRTSDAEALEGLIHPEVREALPTARIRQAVGSWLDREVGEDYVVEVKPAVEVEAYDATHRTFDFGGLKMTFPVAPTHFLQLITEGEARIRTEGEARTVTARGPQTVDAIRADGGRWWIVLPTL